MPAGGQNDYSVWEGNVSGGRRNMNGLSGI